MKRVRSLFLLLGDMFDDLEYLRECNHFFPENTEVLQLQQREGQFVLTARKLALNH
ncbi:uncharacterized protein PHALS_01105 [Plasmopara halstedii]|uniref:Uncharacterized protein n=1 Tax=Plasmopara halstedii TaxID=4781 RepID=A0A0P1ASB8_PLAHL|nr:uncharacterized protein PHALS_01105 [Plasmopara halstedii]CEG44767.1 hypothetical protein PHALS_01105 [Plasmopara halstedii]|eukprot:XP_024581136.1 hypothetical protein PHALS_01105 [Plasmopara halstedii]